LSDFQRAVVGHCRRIPPGQTLTYGQLAARVGRPRAARAVGRVMATNRFPLIVPCHRVVAAGGVLGGFSAPQGLAMKKRLLAAEAASIAHQRTAKEQRP
jgi:methylated-DNA-[protein]-cysteine S-methyltransferase